MNQAPGFSVGFAKSAPCTLPYGNSVHFKKNKSNFLWNPVVSGISSGCCKGTLFLINGEVAF